MYHLWYLLAAPLPFRPIIVLHHNYKVKLFYNMFHYYYCNIMINYSLFSPFSICSYSFNLFLVLHHCCPVTLYCKLPLSPPIVVDIILQLFNELKAGIPISIPDTWFMSLRFVSTLIIAGVDARTFNFPFTFAGKNLFEKFH